MSVRITYFVHGTTTDNLDHKATGWLPGELSPKGISQSIQLRSLINRDQFDIVFCSDLKRAVDSAGNIFENTKTIIQDKRLRECNYGDLNGQDNSLVKYEEHITSPFLNGESLLNVENRIKEFCDFLLTNYDNKNIAIVAHKAPQLALDVITKNISWDEAIMSDWRKTKSWQPGWNYILEN